mmetsp:Transcript_16727/g.50037  ORF Transcript_16727/g.50037 Transcript_16727/m.50037 type:complete len:205 (-) Transcript_16727:75-689(-)|eukprot:CAMPEP_0174232296 /NCGR_PEP_ID=MMETSP0417-20130205/2618_1 /TAXON_ID=242541 /ORGANISM="Mayorella sp, Strain BSH-02190019" /LENGTH=204 /DNA_ID=CAMNT_0015310319 /DNA_START=25 /DNA_END=639 /DNA_ORIENTATION=-
MSAHGSSGKVPSASVVSRPSILDANLRTKRSGDVALSSFSFLFSEFVQYTQARVRTLPALEKRLADVGYQVGSRLIELINYRAKNSKRETKLVGILSFIHTTVWSTVFGKPADSLERSTEHEDEYMIVENTSVVNKYISVSKDLGSLNCAAYAAGIVHGILDSAQFPPLKVTAHSVSQDPQTQPKTVILIKFAPEVIRRERSRQ